MVSTPPHNHIEEFYRQLEETRFAHLRTLAMLAADRLQQDRKHIAHPAPRKKFRTVFILLWRWLIRRRGRRHAPVAATLVDTPAVVIIDIDLEEEQ